MSSTGITVENETAPAFLVTAPAEADAPPPAAELKLKAVAAAENPTEYGLPPDGSKPAASATASESSLSPMSKCSCAKSMCLKLYCECLSKSKYCHDDCDCNDCHNTPEHEGEGGTRLAAIRYILSRKPDALTEELRAKAYEGDWDPSHSKKSPFQKTPKKSAKKTPVKSSAAKTIAKAKDARRKGVAAAAKGSRMEDDESSEEESASAIAFSIYEFPQLILDGSKDHSELATAFRRPLFDHPSHPLEIAYSQHLAVKNKRKQAQKKKNAILQVYNQLREKFLQKKLELSLANDEVKGHSQIVGAWTRKVFDLELEEDCAWNINYKKLKAYKEAHGQLPPNAKKAKDEEEKSLAAWLDRIRGQKNQEDKDADAEDTGKKKHNKNKKFTNDSPHRIECLAELGVVWENHNESKWETMFQKLLVYKEEQGTLRFPSDDQCAATGDEELIALQKWVKSQVLSFRYGKKKNPEITKRLLDVGFDFEKWYAKPGKAKKMKEEKVANFDDIAKSTEDEEMDDIAKSMVEESYDTLPDVKMPAKEEVGDVEMKGVGESISV